jgi:hypothetical protein
MDEFRRAKRIAHQIQHPVSTAEQAFLRQLPPAARQLYRDLKHPPSPEQLAKRYLNSLKARLKSHVKRTIKTELKKLLKRRPRPTLHPVVEAEPPLTSSFEDRIITVTSPHAAEGETTVRVRGMPTRYSSVAADERANVYPTFYGPAPGLMEECDDCIMEMIKESLTESFLDPAVMEEFFEEETMLDEFKEMVWPSL